MLYVCMIQWHRLCREADLFPIYMLVAQYKINVDIKKSFRNNNIQNFECMSFRLENQYIFVCLQSIQPSIAKQTLD